MKTFRDRLTKMPMDRLKEMIKRDKREIEIKRRDLHLMEWVYADRKDDEKQKADGAS